MLACFWLLVQRQSLSLSAVCTSCSPIPSDSCACVVVSGWWLGGGQPRSPRAPALLLSASAGECWRRRQALSCLILLPLAGHAARSRGQQQDERRRKNSLPFLLRKRDSYRQSFSLLRPPAPALALVLLLRDECSRGQAPAAQQQQRQLNGERALGPRGPHCKTAHTRTHTHTQAAGCAHTHRHAD